MGNQTGYPDGFQNVRHQHYRRTGTLDRIQDTILEEEEEEEEALYSSLYQASEISHKRKSISFR